MSPAKAAAGLSHCSIFTPRFTRYVSPVYKNAAGGPFQHPVNSSSWYGR
jgi:hypothetical protein